MVRVHQVGNTEWQMQEELVRKLEDQVSTIVTGLGSRGHCCSAHVHSHALYSKTNFECFQVCRKMAAATYMGTKQDEQKQYKKKDHLGT